MSFKLSPLNELCYEDKTIVESNSCVLPYLGLEMIESQTGVIDWTANTNVGISNCYAFDSRHVLYGKLRPYLNKVALPESSGRCSTEIIPLLPNKGVDRKYLAYLLRRNETIEFVTPENTGSRMPRADMKYLMKMRVPFPPLDVQKRIAAEIERKLAVVARARKVAEEQLNAAKAMKTAVLKDFFSQLKCEWLPISKLCVSITAGGDKPVMFTKHKTNKCAVPVYSNGEKNNGLFGYTDKARIFEKSITVSGRGTIGFSALRDEPYCPIVRLLVLIPNELISCEYLLKALEYNLASGTGTSIPQLTVPMISIKKIPLPTREEQLIFINHIEKKFLAIDEIINKLQDKLLIINALPTAILREAFGGQE